MIHQNYPFFKNFKVKSFKLVPRLVVIHGDTLKNEEQSRWYTPVYIVDGWRFRERLAALIRLTTSPAEVKTAESEEREEIK